MRKQRQLEIDDDLYIQIDLLKNNYDCALNTIKQQKADIKRFLLILIEKDIPIPEDLINRYISKTSLLKDYDDDELPFD